ncbi:hypothetical protein Cgig2_033141 [Carnegiea gigantea]|uniref:Uncharacterized protein n=1 Tax=Carnegiea gigantea TaxID=171969 RepID=A0A9Q1JI70_9CARY|nr:hypothetical protein Cgig2_033141 [Carnegiea gigantea]
MNHLRHANGRDNDGSLLSLMTYVLALQRSQIERNDDFPVVACRVCAAGWVKIKGIATVVFREGFCYFMCLYNGTKVGIHGPPTSFELTGFFLKFVLMSSNSSTEPLSIANSENGDNENLNQISSVSDTSKSQTPYPMGGSRSDHTCIQTEKTPTLLCQDDDIRYGMFF